MTSQNLSSVFVYPREIHGFVCEFLDEVNLTRMVYLSRSWNEFIKEEIDPAWKSLHEKIWNGPLVTTAFFPTAYQTFQVRYKCVKLHLLYQNSLHTLPNIVNNVEKIRKITSNDYFNSLMIERHRGMVLNKGPLSQFAQTAFPLNLKALPLTDSDKKCWQTAFNCYDSYSNPLVQMNSVRPLLDNHLKQATPIYLPSSFRECARYIVTEISMLCDLRTLINPDESVVDSCLSHTVQGNYLASEVQLVMWKILSPHLFEEKSKELLFEAANRGALDIIGALLQERDCSVKKAGEGDDKNWTVLHYLSLRQDTQIPPVKAPLWQEIADELIKRGCSPLQRGDNGDSPLILAARAGNAYLMSCFLKHLQNVSMLSEGWAQLIEVLEEDREELLSDSQIKIIGMALKQGFCADIRANENLINKMLIKSEWNILPLFLNSCSPAQMEAIFSLFFKWADIDCAFDDDDLSIKMDTYSVLLPNLEMFLEISQSKNLDFNKVVDSEGNTCLHQCIKFFEGEIQALKENIFDDGDEEDEGEEILDMLQKSYINCVKILATNQNSVQANRDLKDPLDLVDDREGDVYLFLLAKQNPSKKRGLKD